MHKIAIYPGTFDPVTNGHVDIIKRASTLFDEIIVAVADSKKKNPLFDIKQRLAMVEEATKDLHNVKVASFNMLLVEFVKRNNANIIIRGLRAVSDFEYEIQLGYANSSLDSSIETVYLMPTLEQAFVSSS
ncbi:MAG: pantetheine-phosphate adenylyltransferase, partial [Thiovulaceae bacterium]|nr:pantetheine-phosphate adenylyltransferase [Sulfurimonadaceae bacterium]